MPTATPYLASWQRRLIAAAFDSLALVLVLLVLINISHAMDVSPAIALPLLLLAYLIYHSVALLVPRIGVGRIVAGISVVSIREDGIFTKSQAIVRPLVRLAAIIAAIFVCAFTDNFGYSAIPVAIEISLIALTPWRQSVADLLARTIVVNVPKPEPHRAVAGPLFSATDSEFGFPPRRPRPP